MGNTAARDHPVQRTRADDLVGSGAVAVVKVAAIKVGDGPETDMRVRTDVDALAGQQFRRARLIEEDEWSHHLSLRGRQGAPDLKAAEVASAGNDEGLDRVDANLVRAAWFDCGVPAHVRTPFLSGGRFTSRSELVAAVL